MDKTFDTVLMGRTMQYPPWVGRATRSRRDKNTFLQPGFAVNRVIGSFSDVGGDKNKLLSLLNDHFPEGYRKLTSHDFETDACRYSLEFYLYLIMFTKYILKDSGFRYNTDQENELDKYHFFFEQGPLQREPWLFNNEVDNNYLSIINMKSMFDYVELSVPPPPLYGGNPAQAGKELSALGLAILNNSAPPEYQAERSFFDKEEILISFEYLGYISVIFYCLTNDVDFFKHSLYYGFRHNTTLTRAVFLQPEFSPVEGLRNWLMRTNNIHKMEIQEKGRYISVGFNLKRLLQTEAFGLYQASMINATMQANLGSMKAFFEMAANRPVKTRISKKKTTSSYFVIICRSNTPVKTKWVMIGSGLSALMILTVILLGLRGLTSGWKFPAAVITGFTVISGLTSMALYWQNRLSILKKRFFEAQKIINKQLSTLNSRTEDLLKERNLLEEKVQERIVELSEALAQVKRLDTAKTNFLANVSHELRTPLTLLTLPMKEIREGRWGASMPVDHQMFSLMNRNITRIKLLVNRLLDFARLDLGTVDFNPVPVDMLEYCRLLVAELSSLAESRSLRLNLESESSITRFVVEADLVMLETVLLNLLFNAIKFTSEGTVCLQLNPAAGGFLRLVVRDTGIGIPREDKERIFERFTQMEEHKERRYEGTGLGLALVKEIVNIHQWSLDLESEPGIGSSFILTIPLVEEEPHHILPDTKHNIHELTEIELITVPEPSLQRTFSREDTLLVVEDNPDMGTLLHNLLEDQYNVQWCRSGFDALAFLDGSPPVSLIICDVMMPGMSGIQFLEKLHQEGECADIPFIFLTALSSPEDKEKGLLCGAVDYITKPFTRDELLVKVKNLLATRKASYLQAIRDKEGANRLSRMYPEGISLSRDADWALSPRTISTHLSHIYDKTDTQNRVELLRRLFPDA